MSELLKAVNNAVVDARQSYVLNTKHQPIIDRGIEYCPDCLRKGDGEKCRLVFGMQSDGEFHTGKPQKRKNFNLVRPVIATKACKSDGCGYWWPAFSFTPTAPQEVNNAI